jgi:hypothetical protein
MTAAGPLSPQGPARRQGALWWAAASLGIAMLACARADLPATGLPTIVTQRASLTPGRPTARPASPTPPQTATATLEINDRRLLTRYSLQAILQGDLHHLDVQETIHYVHRSPAAAPDLVLVVEANRLPGRFDLQDLTWGDGRKIEGARLEGGLLSIPLAGGLQPGDSVDLRANYTLNLPDERGSLAATPRQSNFVDWYLRLPPYDAEMGWRVHEPTGVGEHQSYESADVDVRLRLPDEPGLMLAASGVPQAEGDWSIFHLQDVRDFSWSVSRQLVVLSAMAQGIELKAYVFAEHQVAGDAALQTASEALSVFQKRFSPYPLKRLSIVEADFFDGRESSGIFFLDTDYFAAYNHTPGGYLTALAAHETAHQWWFSVIGNDQAREPWLDESLSCYSEALYYEEVHPDWLAWWWDYRVQRFKPEGDVGGSIDDFPNFRTYVNAVYLNGAVFLQQLRQIIGDSAFNSFLADYAAQGAGRLMTGQDFFSLLDTHTAQDLSPFIASYFLSR